MGDVVAVAGPRRPFYRTLYVQVIAAILLGGLIGWLWPPAGVALQPLGDGFIKLIKMMIAPIIFCTVVSGIAGVTNVQKVGRVGGKALIFGIDKFMSECRALTNIIGNGVATVVISAWERELDRARLASVLHGRADAEPAMRVRAAGGE